MKKILIVAAGILLTVLSIITLTSCGGGSGSASTGTLQVSLTDAVQQNYSSVVIRIKEVKVVQNGNENARNNDGGLPIIADFSGEDGGGREIDVVKLHFLQEILGKAVVPAGTYTQVRLILVDNSNLNNPVNYVIPNGGTKKPLITPSGQESGVKVLGRFVVEEGVINAIMIDFDPETAVVKDGSSGNYNLKPTGIRIVQLEDVLSSYGSLSGRVAAFQRWSSAVVSVLVSEGTAPVAAGTVFSNNSSSIIWSSKFSAFVPEGSYQVHVTDVTGGSFRPYTSHTAFPVVTGSDADVGTITLAP
ncbi:MAG: DUF4382 domain-containing protein [Deltaproteobacteria bacterium]|nr:DUF4382 domain-containing protein [Deltaproteobacteria bacterium]